MQVTINIDEKLFDAVFNEQFSNIPKEALTDIAVKSFGEWLQKNADKLFITKNSGYGYNDNYSPTTLMQQMIKQFDLTPAFEQIQKAFIELFEKNYETIAIKAFTECFTQGLSNSSGFNIAIRMAVDHALAERKV